MRTIPPNLPAIKGGLGKYMASPNVRRLTAAVSAWLLILAMPVTDLRAQTVSGDQIISDQHIGAVVWPQQPTTFRCALVSCLGVSPRRPLNGARIPDAMGNSARDHRWEGAAVGAAGLGLALLALTAGLCNSDSGTRSCTYPIVGATITGAVVGGTLGLFIGSAVPKEGKDSL